MMRHRAYDAPQQLDALLSAKASFRKSHGFEAPSEHNRPRAEADISWMHYDAT
jgi:hypothetical protein